MNFAGSILRSILYIPYSGKEYNHHLTANPKSGKLMDIFRIILPFLAFCEADMVFSSYIFIFTFLPVVLLGYFGLSKLKNPFPQRLFLILASLFFYGYYNVSYLALIVVSIVINYAVALCLPKKGGILFYVAGILFNVCLLGYFKYYDFFISNVNALFATSFQLKHIVLPLGISFFTFQQLSFLISVWNKETALESFWDYCIFVLFFPQLVAGPIVLYSEMIPQFKDLRRRTFHADHFARGSYMFCIGLFKKIVIADTLALFVNNGFSAGSLGFCAAWATALSYTFQIYFDFSGYSDMAIGLGQMFNIDIPENFRSPYLSESITVFWRRWHITLGRALSTYVYRPLGGNRRGAARTYLNLFLTFLVSGLWHGAAWTFVLWGVLHGICMVVERFLGKRLDRIPRVLRIGVTFLIVNALWVLFRAENFAQAQMVYAGMCNLSWLAPGQMGMLINDGLIAFPNAISIAYLLGILGVLFVVIWAAPSSITLYQKFTPNRKTMIFTAVAFCVSLLHLSRESVFIYFNF